MHNQHNFDCVCNLMLRLIRLPVIAKTPPPGRRTQVIHREWNKPLICMHTLTVEEPWNFRHLNVSALLFQRIRPIHKCLVIEIGGQVCQTPPITGYGMEHIQISLSRRAHFTESVLRVFDECNFERFHAVWRKFRSMHSVFASRTVPRRVTQASFIWFCWVRHQPVPRLRHI